MRLVYNKKIFSVNMVLLAISVCCKL